MKNDPANGGAVASDAKISFDAPAVGAVTRAVAGEIVNPYDKEEHFTVYARHYTGNYTNFNAGTPYMTAVETATMKLAIAGIRNLPVDRPITGPRTES